METFRWVHCESMESTTLDAMKKELAGREALHAYKDKMAATDAVLQYAFWHLDKKRGGKLSGSVASDLSRTHPLQFIEMVMEQVQIDLLTGAARKHNLARRAASRPFKAQTEIIEQRFARSLRVKESRASRPPRTHLQDVALKWKAVVVKQNELAEESANWSPTRVTAMQKKHCDRLDCMAELPRCRQLTTSH